MVFDNSRGSVDERKYRGEHKPRQGKDGPETRVKFPGRSSIAHACSHPPPTAHPLRHFLRHALANIDPLRARRDRPARILARPPHRRRPALGRPRVRREAHLARLRTRRRLRRRPLRRGHARRRLCRGPPPAGHGGRVRRCARGRERRGGCEGSCQAVGGGRAGAGRAREGV